MRATPCRTAVRSSSRRARRVLRPGDGSRSEAGRLRLPHRDATPASGWMRRRCSARWSRSSPPRDPARAPGSACPWCTASPSNPADGFTLQSRPGRRHDRRALAAGREGAGRRRSIKASAQPAMRPRTRPSLVVLAVDDDGLVLTNTVAMLDDLGHTGLAASSGRRSARHPPAQRLGRSGHHRPGHAANDRPAACRSDQTRMAGPPGHPRHRLRRNSAGQPK